MKKILSFAVFVCGVFLSFAALSAQEIYELWPGTAPGETVREAEVGKRHEDGLYRVSQVTMPTLRLYRPAKKSTDALMLIFPGGGYSRLAAEHEGTQVAEYLNSKGVTTAVVHYRVPRRQVQLRSGRYVLRAPMRRNSASIRKRSGAWDSLPADI